MRPFPSETNLLSIYGGLLDQLAGDNAAIACVVGTRWRTMSTATSPWGRSRRPRPRWQSRVSSGRSSSSRRSATGRPLTYEVSADRQSLRINSRHAGAPAAFPNDL